MSGNKSRTVRQSERRRPRYRLLKFALALVGFAALLVTVNVFGLRDRLFGTQNALRIRSLAVLPMANLSGDQSQDYFADGMTDTLISGLAKVRALKVISRTSVVQYKGGQKNISEIGRELNVDALMEGSVQRVGDRIKITVQLIDTANDHHIWSETYDREFRDVLMLQNEVARAVTDAIQIKLTEQEKSDLSRSAPINTAAYEFFWRGRYYLNSQTIDNNEKAIAMFEQAVAADPEFAAGFAALSQACVWRLFLFTPNEEQWEEKAYVAAEKAMSLDPDLADAHLARGRVLWTPKNRFPHDKVIHEYLRALELDPNLDEARNQLSLVYNHVGALDQALVQLRQALETNPTNNTAKFRTGETLLFKGEYDKALAALGSVPNDTNPPLTESQIVWTLWNLGRTDEALEAIRLYLEKNPSDDRGLFTSIQAVIAAASGDFDEANEKIRLAMEKGKGFGHFHHTLFNVACAYARMNKPEQAVELLERAAKDGFPCYPLFAKDPNLNNIRQDPRFVAFLADVKKQSESYYSNP